MDEISKIAAELASNSARKEADIGDQAQQLLQRAGSYLGNPQNQVARNALIGAAGGGLAGLAGSSKGRRLGDTLRGAAFGGTIGGGGTLAYKNLTQMPTGQHSAASDQAAVQRATDRGPGLFNPLERPLTMVAGGAGAYQSGKHRMLDIKGKSHADALVKSHATLAGLRDRLGLSSPHARRRAVLDTFANRIDAMGKAATPEAEKLRKLIIQDPQKAYAAIALSGKHRTTNLPFNIKGVNIKPQEIETIARGLPRKGWLPSSLRGLATAGTLGTAYLAEPYIRRAGLAGLKSLTAPKPLDQATVNRLADLYQQAKG